jgi:toxin ParE1/3/4
MVVRFYKSDAARNDLLEIWQYIAADNVQAADDLFAQFEKAFTLLVDNPQIGSAVESLPLRRWVLGRYIIFYRINEDCLEIIRILRGARELEMLL